ncbi:MAG: DNA polymerase IV [Saprospiraceae bacterium]|nr:DNA polymerase IV [Saprospiraceae bacterium]
MKHFLLHMDLDSFFVSVERMKDPTLNGKPVIIGAVGRRGVVSSCSYEARQFGVHSAMAGFKAHALCPNGIFLRGDMESYAKYSRMVTQIIAEKAPLFEKASIDEFYVDLTGMDKYFGCYQWAQELRHTITRETGLPISFGLASNKTLAKMATNQAKPNGHLFVEHGQEIEFLNPLPIKEIPSLGKKTQEFLQLRKIHTVEELRGIGEAQLLEWFGKFGQGLWRKVNGKGSVTIQPYSERKSISKEHTFHVDLSDSNQLKSILFGMAEQLAHRLRLEGRMVTNLAIKMRTADFDTITRQTVIPPTFYEHELIPEITTFFEKIYHKKPLRLVGLRLAGFVEKGSYQTNVFEDFSKNKKLYEGIDSVKDKFGKYSIQRASSTPRKRHDQR